MDRNIIYNGKLISESEFPHSESNRAFRYGDGLFESIRCCHGKLMFLEDHIKRLLWGMELLKMEIPYELTDNIVQNHVNNLKGINDDHGDFRVRLQVYRNEGGFYTPEDNSVSWVISLQKLDSEGYALNKEGYSAGIYPEIKKPLNILSSIKSSNALLYVLAGHYKEQKGWGQGILLNVNNKIVETTSANLFLLKGRTVITPPISDGCVIGVMRKRVKALCRQMGLEVHEKSLVPDDLLEADEVFTTNATLGVQWIGAIKQKRYFNNLSKKLTVALNDLIPQRV